MRHKKLAKSFDCHPRQSAQRDRLRRGVAEIDTPALHEWTAVVDPDPDGPTIRHVCPRDVATEAPGAMRRRQGVGVELSARSRSAAVVPVADAIVAGDAGFDIRHLDVDGTSSRENVL